MKRDYSIVLEEVYQIIKIMGKIYINQIPEDIWNIIENKRNKDYIFKYDFLKNLEEQNLGQDTLELLSYLNLNFWCDEQERNELKKIYLRNQAKAEMEKRKRFNPDEVFKKKLK